jgi:hypothetical protein
VVVELGSSAGKFRKRRHQRTLGFVNLIKHGAVSDSDAAKSN